MGFLHLVDYIVGITSGWTAVALWAAVCLLAAHRRLWTRLPCVFAYLVALVVGDAARVVVFRNAGYNSKAYGWTYWIIEGILTLGRGTVLADICRAALGSYTGVWQLARYLLGAAAVVMLALGGLHTGEALRIDSYVIFVQRELEYAIVLTLLLLLLLSRYYRVALGRPVRGIALGLAFYSSVAIVCNSIYIYHLGLTLQEFGDLKNLAFVLALGIWSVELRGPLPVVAPPVLDASGSYDRNAQVMAERMRILNDWLMQILKKQ